MAARLNTPADFLLPKTTAATPQQGDLLPPSVFETPLLKSVPGPSDSKDDPWQELSKATSEILELKSQLQLLRESRHVTLTPQGPIKAQVDVRHQQLDRINDSPAGKDVHAISLGHMDEIIQRQAADIAQLRQKLAQVELEKQKDEACRESEKKLSEAAQKQQVAALEEEIITLRERHTEQINKANLESETTIEDKNRRIAALEESSKGSNENFRSELLQLQKQLDESERRSQQIEDEFQRTIRKKDEEIQDLKQQTSQLRIYVAETENNYKSTDTWRREIDNLNTKLKLRDEEASNLQQQLELSHIRQEAQNRMLSLQEQQLSKIKDETLDKKRNVLLTRWREKVYELMVQAKSVEISHQNQEHNWKLKVQGMEEGLETAYSENRLRTAELEDKEAQLKMSEHQIKNLEIEITRAQDVALNLDKTSGEQWNHIQQLAQAAKGIYNKFKESVGIQEQIESSLKSYDQRISFAAGRVFMLQSQFARKEALLKLKYEKPTHEKEDHLQIPIEPSEIDALKLELCRLTGERDVLSRQLQQDSQLLEHKVNQAKERVESELHEMEDTIQRQRDQIDSKNQLIGDLQSEVAARSQEIEIARKQLEQCQEEMKNTTSDLEKEMSSKMDNEREQFTEQLAEMERKMNEARREQTKAVVSLRQLERSTGRIKEQMTERISELEKSHKIEILKLESKLRNSEKDRNLVMATLRQEGLVGQYKSQRADPANPDLTTSESSEMVEPLVETLRGTKTTMPESDSEPLHTVIDDLKTLTADVIDDEDDDVLEAA